MTKIQTRPFHFGDENESSWPPRFGTGGAGIYHRDKATGKVVEGPPPHTEVRYGEAPAIFTDTIEPYYHPGAEQWVDSRARLRDCDKATGCITTDKLQPADPSWAKEQERRRRKDLTECLHKAVAQVDAGTAPLTEEQRAACTRENERISSALGIDAFNVVGRKNDKRGKRWKRRR